MKALLMEGVKKYLNPSGKNTFACIFFSSHLADSRCFPALHVKKTLIFGGHSGQGFEPRPTAKVGVFYTLSFIQQVMFK